MRELHRQYPEKQLYFIIGADSVEQLHTWNNIEEMLQLATFIGAGRPGYEGIMDNVVKNLGEEARQHIMLLNTPEYDVSSTDIRERIREGASLMNLVPKVVEDYIYAHGLYKK